MPDDKGILGIQTNQGTAQGIIQGNTYVAQGVVTQESAPEAVQGVTQGTTGVTGGQVMQSGEPVFQSFAPYPEIKVERPNLYYAEILMDDFSGVISEFTSVNQYTYHASDFVNLDEYLVNMWTKIANVERGHLKALSKVIVQLGGKPIYRGSASTNGGYWYGGFVKYGSNICEQLQTDLESELQAIENYKQHILIIKDGNIQQVLERIIRDEEVHVKNFKDALKRYCNM